MVLEDSMPTSLWLTVLGLAFVASISALPRDAARAQTTEAVEEPLNHPVVRDPKNISPERAEAIYRAIRDTLQRQYGASADPVTQAYPRWKRYNTSPYRSRQHGNMFVNNYANDLAAQYGRYEQAGTLPAGSMVVKDSFVVRADGSILAGPLFLMEKMAPGFDPDNLDWRYMTILPDGEIEGLSSEDGPGGTAYCAACHQRARKHHLFFLPERYRR